MARIPTTLIVMLAVQNVELWRAPENENPLPGASAPDFAEASWEVARDSDERFERYTDAELAAAWPTYKRAFMAAAAVA